MRQYFICQPLTTMTQPLPLLIYLNISPEFDRIEGENMLMERHRPDLEAMKFSRNKSENKESSFETAKQAVLDFLATPHFEYRHRENIDARTPEYPTSGTPAFVIKFLKEKLDTAMLEAPSDNARVEFVHALWKNDFVSYGRAVANRGEFIPPIFSQREDDLLIDYNEKIIARLADQLENGEDVSNNLELSAQLKVGWDYKKGKAKNPDEFEREKQRLLTAAKQYADDRSAGKIKRKFEPYTMHEGPLETDVVRVATVDNNHDRDTQVTYRSLYYPVLIEQLSKIENANLAENEILEYLETVDPATSRNTDPNDNYDAQNIERGFTRVYTSESLIKNFSDTEFGTAKIKALEVLRSLDQVSPAVCEYLITKGMISDTDGYRECLGLITDVLNKQPAVSGDLLMQVIRRPDSPPVIRSLAIQTLYHLELGKIGMSADGVKYLGKIFDLGAHNNPNHFAHRLTGDGKVGIFDDQKNAVGYFQLHDLASPEQKVQAEMLEFNLNTLFLPTPNETPSERAERESILAEFKEKYFATYLTDFYQDTGVHFNNLNFKEQGWFLWYAQHATDNDKTRALKFVKKYREGGFKTFLSLEQDKQNGEAILSLGEKLPPETARAIFAKYGEIVEAAEGVSDYLGANFKSNFSNSEIADQVVVSLLKSGKNLLVGFAEKIKRDDGSESEIESQEIIAELNKVNVGILRLGNTLKQLPREEVSNLDLNNLKEIDKMKNISGQELLNQYPELLEQIKAIIRKQFPQGDDQEFEDEILGSDKIKLNVTLADGEVLSFYSKKEFAPSSYYLDWFISNPDAAVKGLGEPTLKSGFNEDARRNDSYYAVAKPHVKAFMINIESLGFCAFAGSTDNGEYKHHYVRISHMPGDGNLISKTFPEAKNAEFAQVIQSVCKDAHEIQPLIFGGSAFNVAKVEFDKNLKISDDVKKTDPDGWVMRAVEDQSKRGFVLTRYIPESNAKNNRVFFAVFEKDPNIKKRNELFEAYHDSSNHSAEKKALSI